MKTLNIKSPSVLLRPRMTEKAAINTEKNVYVFEVKKDATKSSVSASVKALYKVTPVKVRMATTPSKVVFIRGKKGVKSGFKKAYVQLKKGDKIELL